MMTWRPTRIAAGGPVIGEVRQGEAVRLRVTQTPVGSDQGQAYKGFGML